MQITYGDKNHDHNSNVLLLLFGLYYSKEIEKNLPLVIP